MQGRAQLGRDDEDLGARFQQGGHPPGGHRAAAGDQDGAAIQAEPEQVGQGLGGDHGSAHSSSSGWQMIERNGSPGWARTRAGRA